ncbi:putative disease resistance protein [Dorcoceras hygrometricum]|uniref:Putative disease resistance protein n=1 Tax=Dorcoceras hygrometricum TaxID=472368 RepID=A0A2Z7CRB3_9LAMI|nr:putative disease resistance protein [Dorcoceras hygrometricum]
MSFVKANVIYDCCESMTYNDQNSPKLNHQGKAGISFQRPENFKPSWLSTNWTKTKRKLFLSHLFLTSQGVIQRSLEKSDDDVPQRYSAETQQTLDTPHNIAQQDLTGNPVVIDLTNDDSIQEQIFPSVPAAGGEATNDQPDVAQSDVVQPDFSRSDVVQAGSTIHKSMSDAQDTSVYQLAPGSTSGEQGASTSYQSVSIPTSGQPVASDHQLVSRPTVSRADPSSHLEQQSQQLESDAQANNEEYQLASADPVVIQPVTQGELGANPIGLDLRWNKNHLPEQVIDAFFKVYQQTVGSSTVYIFQQMATVNINQQVLFDSKTMSLE